MEYHKKVQYIAIAVFVTCLTGFLINATSAVQGYNTTEQEISDLIVDERIHIEMVRFSARDGADIKSLYYTNSQNYNKTDQSVPVIIASHGMSTNYFMFNNFAYTMAKEYGFAVFLIEARGHGSSSEASTLAYKEGTDIIDLLDHIETEDHFSGINTSASATFGHSMGALYAMAAYIEESLGKGRFQYIVAGSGPLNITREVYFLTNNPFIIGNSSLINFLEGKNPVNRVNSTFPKNMMLWHGTEDSTVDYRCTTDFISVIDPDKLEDPDAGREDIIFFSLEGVDHNLPKSFEQHAISAFNEILMQNTIDPDDVEIFRNPVNFKASADAKQNVLYAMIFLMFVVPAAIFAFWPTIFNKPDYTKLALTQIKKKSPDMKDTKHNSKENDLDNNTIGQETFEISTELEVNAQNKSFLKQNAVILAYYFGLQFIGGLIMLFIPLYLATKLVIIGILGFVFLVFISSKKCNNISPHYRTSQQVQEITKKSLNIQNGLIMVVPVIAFIVSFIAITNSYELEDRVLVNGTRTSWIFYVIWAYISVQLITSIIIARSMQKKPNLGINSMITEMFLVFIISLGSFFFFLISLAGQAHLIIPAWFDFNVDVVFAVTVLFSGMFMVFDLIIQIGEKIFKNILPTAVGLAIIVPFFAFLEELIYFY